MPTLKPRAVVACVLMLFALWMTTDGRNGFAGQAPAPVADHLKPVYGGKLTIAMPYATQVDTNAVLQTNLYEVGLYFHDGLFDWGRRREGQADARQTEVGLRRRAHGDLEAPAQRHVPRRHPLQRRGGQVEPGAEDPEAAVAIRPFAVQDRGGGGRAHRPREAGSALSGPGRHPGQSELLHVQPQLCPEGGGRRAQDPAVGGRPLHPDLLRTQRGAPAEEEPELLAEGAALPGRGLHPDRQRPQYPGHHAGGGGRGRGAPPLQSGHPALQAGPGDSGSWKGRDPSSITSS